jgi:malonyl CoA-acyl carrier protein transacylase
MGERDKAEFLEDVDPEHYFYVDDGAWITNLGELRDKLGSMDDATFKHHVTNEKNDFHNWVKDVVGDSELADQLAKANSQQEAAALVEKRVAWLETKKKESLCEHRKHLNCGAMEFMEGLALGIIIGLILARILF